MKKYLVVNEFTLPDEVGEAFTRTSVVGADSPRQAILKVASNALFNKEGDKWNVAANDGRLDQATVGIYELVSGRNELPELAD